MAAWFFFSYTRDDQDPLLRQFYEDLCKEIRLTTHLGEHEPGFLDQRDIDIGDRWTEKLTEALRTCKVFVSICSPNYFASEYCGKEFQICLNRQASSRKTSTAMVSVIWGSPKGSVHHCMKKFQYTHSSLPPEYAKKGLRYIMKVGLFRDKYEEFITNLAAAIVQVGQKSPLPELPVIDPIESVRNAFAKAAAANLTTVEDYRRNAHFTYVAGSQNEISGLPRNLVRDLRVRYGRGGRDWRPFYPDFEDTVGNVAMLATARQKLYYNEFPVDPKLVQRIRDAEKQREIVILLVDPWTIRVKTYRELMEEYDRSNFENCAVLIAWNSVIKTKAQRKKFQEELARTFKFRANRYQRSVYYVDSISTDRDLRNTLAKTLAKLQNSLIENSEQQQQIKHATLSKKARQQGIELRRQPIVSGPGDRGR